MLGEQQTVCQDAITELMKNISPDSLQEIKQKSKELKTIKLNFDEKYTELVQFLNSMISQKSVVSRIHTLERLQRKIEIAKNVSDTLSMGKDTLVEEQVEQCTIEGVIIANLDFPNFQEMLKCCDMYSRKSEGYLDSHAFLEENYDKLSTKCLHPNARCLNLDGDTYRTIVAVTESKPRELLGSKLCVSLPGIASDYTCIGIPLYDIFVKMKKPVKNWNELANLPYIAHWRIALRNTCTEAISSRDFELPASSTILGAGLCMTVLSYIETLVSGVTAPPEEGSTLLNIIRGSFGFLLTLMSSGQNSQMKVWEMFNDDKHFTVPNNYKVWLVYQRVMKIAYMARWVTQDILKKYIKISTAFIAENSSLIN